MENLIYQITNEIKGLDEYIKAMKKVYKNKGIIEDLDNLLLYINSLKAWAGIDVEMNGNSLHKHNVSISEAKVCRCRNKECNAQTEGICVELAFGCDSRQT